MLAFRADDENQQIEIIIHWRDDFSNKGRKSGVIPLSQKGYTTFKLV